jgi:cold-inducible RNA-binding protein
MNIYVGNISRDLSEEELREAFGAFGQVSTVNIIKDKFTGEYRGFAFVEMPVKEEADAAINSLNGKELKGRALNVNEARPRNDDRKGGGGGGGGRGGPRRGGFGGGGGGGRRRF